MNKEIERLLHTLREAIHDALAESSDIVAAMAALERAGRCPTFAVDVTLDDEQLPREESTLALTTEDEQFLKSLKIVSPA